METRTNFVAEQPSVGRKTRRPCAPGRARIRQMRPRIDPFEKRRKELARKEWQKQKAERKDLREKERAERAAGLGEDEDPDIAGIVPGPQPPPDENGGGGGS